SPFDDGLRTPILLRWDGHTRPATHQSLCSSVDLLPTVLDALKFENKAPDLPGRSLWPSATGQKPLADQPVFGEIYPGDASTLGHPSRDLAYRWIREGQFKLIVPHSSTGKKPWGGYLSKVALFDVMADPIEQHNLAEDKKHTHTISRLTQRLDDWWTPKKSPTNTKKK
ncbi:MAG: hypothetical protein KDA84_01030, partial [Planctomycetaceae bacterium]|nr:hypothetical protein [Planctomycetaceae bacterium]